MYNLRYHIVSLVSVFLALALGLILGGLTVGSGMVDQQEKSLVAGLQREFAQLREENRSLTDENVLIGSFTADTVDAWTAGRLEDHTVLIVSSPGLDDGVDSVRQAVEAAGGRSVVVTLLRSNFGLADKKMAATVTSLAPDPKSVSSSIATSLAAEWLSAGAPRDLTTGLADAGAMRVEGLADDMVVSAVVNLAGREGESDPAGVQLMRAYSDMGLVTVGAESPDAATGVAKQASRLGQSALDTLGTPIGKFTLISVLTGDSEGYFGSGQSAQDPYPAITFR